MRFLRLVLTALTQPWSPWSYPYESGVISAMSMFGVVVAVPADRFDVPSEAGAPPRPLTAAERQAWQILTAHLLADHPERFGPPSS
ncbi:hypothetical protein ODJ79_42285 [Actinoplanes sp. KI2]|uniref:hypothetical protein n=1 Tax=Actinoplanes sp. KI2 TaxID=2983315 RepID=UPI0021D5D7DE|nr:hypothetical protein [Actinoplanes sp. KI2]MCU7730388.1 hypothetical protein [Actinoplanes sp. KI2]